MATKYFTPDVERTYSTPEVAAFYNKKVQWCYWGMRPRTRADGVLTAPPWVRADGTPIAPRRVGRRRERRFTLDDIKEIALARYRRHNITEHELNRYLRHLEEVAQGKAELIANLD